ncbi:hypothetical protein JCM21900_002459 [Sporobolomyces salmonicolor]
MKPPLTTNSLPPDLAARFTALRGPRRPSQDEERGEGKGPSLDFDERLKRLEPPRAEEQHGVTVEGNEAVRSSRSPVVRSEAERCVAVARVLSLSAPSSRPPSADSDPDSPARPRLPLPSWALSSEDTLSGVVVEFMRPSLGSSVGDVSLDAGAPGEEADDLLQRMRDELVVEASTRRRAEASADRWEARREALKGVAAGPTRREVEERERLGTPPELGELARVVEKRCRRAKGTGGASETDSEEESDESENETEDSGTESEARIAAGDVRSSAWRTLLE